MWNVAHLVMMMLGVTIHQNLRLKHHYVFSCISTMSTSFCVKNST